MVGLWDLLTLVLGTSVVGVGVLPVLDKPTPLNVTVGLVAALGLGVFAVGSLRRLGKLLLRLLERQPSLETHAWVFLAATAAYIVGWLAGTYVAVQTLLSVLP